MLDNGLKKNKNLKSLISLSFTLIVSYCSSQINVNTKDTVYLNQNNIEISRVNYDKFVNSKLYHSRIYKDNENKIVVLKARKSYGFATLEKATKEQLFKILYSRNNVDTTKTMTIHYSDTLKKIDEFPKKNQVINTKFGHKYIINHKSFIKSHKACIKRFKNQKKAKVYHFYKINNGHPNSYKKLKWIKDNLGIIEYIFNDKIGRFKTIVIRPNGDYFFINYNEQNRIIYHDISTGKLWDKHTFDYKNQFYSLNN